MKSCSGVEWLRTLRLPINPHAPAALRGLGQTFWIGSEVDLMARIQLPLRALQVTS